MENEEKLDKPVDLSLESGYNVDTSGVDADQIESVDDVLSNLRADIVRLYTVSDRQKARKSELKKKMTDLKASIKKELKELSIEAKASGRELRRAKSVVKKFEKLVA